MGNRVPRVIKLEPAAVDLCQEFRVKNHEAIASGSAHPILNGWRGKNDGRLLRVAAVFEFLEWSVAGGPEPQMVSVTSMKRAWRYLAYCEEMFEHVLGDLAQTEAHRDAAQIARYLRDQGMRVVNERTLYRERGFHHLRNPDRRKAAFLELEAAGWIRKNVGLAGDRAAIRGASVGARRRPDHRHAEGQAGADRLIWPGPFGEICANHQRKVVVVPLIQLIDAKTGQLEFGEASGAAGSLM